MEIAVLKHSLAFDPKLSEVITANDMEKIAGNASCFCSVGFLAGFPGYFIIDYRSLDARQRSALADSYMKHYTDPSMHNVFTLEKFEHQIASIDAYMTGHIRLANLNNLIFFPVSGFFKQVFKNLSL